MKVPRRFRSWKASPTLSIDGHGDRKHVNIRRTTLDSYNPTCRVHFEASIEIRDIDKVRLYDTKESLYSERNIEDSREGGKQVSNGLRHVEQLTHR